MRALLILVTIIVIAATAGTIVVGGRTFEGLVVAKPYEAGLAWEEARRKQADLGWSVSVLGAQYRTGGNDLIVRVADKKGMPLADADVSVKLSRASTRAYDKTYRAQRGRDGSYRASVELSQFGYWDLKAEVSRNNERYAFTDRIYAEKF